MAWLDRGFKQRLVGALVLVALAVIFLPMLLSREDERRLARVEPPPIPQAPVTPDIAMEPVPVPEPGPVEEPLADPVLVEEPDPIAAFEPPPAVVPPPPAAKPPVAAPTAPAEPRLDAAGLPVSWSIQLASLSSRANADALVQKLRSGGYNAYLRSVDGMHRVFVGPLIDRAEADKLRDQLERQQKLKGFVVRFQP